MTITKVKYEKLFPTGAYLNEKIGFEADLESNPKDESVRNLMIMKSVEFLRQLAEQSHKEKYPHLYTESGSPVTVVPVPEYMGEGSFQIKRTREDEIKAHLQTINECRTLRNLEMFANMVQRENESVLFEAYNNKKKELQ